MDTLLPVLSLPEDILSEKGDLAPCSLFKNPYKELWFEIGFGAGEHLAALMCRHPENAYIGAEPFVNGMAAFLKEIMPHTRHSGESGNLEAEKDPCFRREDTNVRVHMDDAMMIANSLEDACLDGIYVLNPDPWHKKRHYKRRIIRQENLDCFARILKPGGQLIMSTDVPDLADWMVTQASVHPAFEWAAEKAEDWRIPPEDWITTAYEVKGAKGAKVMSYLFFERV